jgi:hypothetical protein
LESRQQPYSLDSRLGIPTATLFFGFQAWNSNSFLILWIPSLEFRQLPYSLDSRLGIPTASLFFGFQAWNSNSFLILWIPSLEFRQLPYSLDSKLGIPTASLFFGFQAWNSNSFLILWIPSLQCRCLGWTGGIWTTNSRACNSKKRLYSLSRFGPGAVEERLDRAKDSFRRLDPRRMCGVLDGQEPRIRKRYRPISSAAVR